jgi:LmbE family N-acetylglucosaminyl deacetylase
MKKAVLFISTHPDDETIGCGGTILRHKANGDKVYWVIATAMKLKDGYDKRAISNRENEIRRVAKTYGFSKIYNLGISTRKVDKYPRKKLTGRISEIMNEVRPDTTYLPFMSDIHSDHRVIFEAAYSCTKIFRFPFIKKILMMEVLSETEFAPPLKDSVFIPNYFVDISNFLGKKLTIMKIYKSELSKHPFPRNLKNIKALAVSRGALAGCKYAEAFMLLKQID